MINFNEKKKRLKELMEAENQIKKFDELFSDCIPNENDGNNIIVKIHGVKIASSQS